MTLVLSKRLSRRISYILAGSVLSLLFCSASLAAIQGTAGALQSSAVTTITLNIQPNIQISNVSDVELNVTDRSQDIEVEERICVRGNLGSRYTVIAGGQNGNQNPFQLNTPSGESIPYEVYFRGDLGQSNKDQLLPGQTSPFYSNYSRSQDCDGDDTAEFSLVFRSSALLPALPGVYSGFLTLTVAAE